MDGNENITGKGMDFMSIWQQHYYTWSTRSLSGNKVGLGIVAASNTDRESLRIAGVEGAKAEPCRQEEGVSVERMHYVEESKSIFRTSSVPFRQAADQRNNKFVHIYSTSCKDFKYPEDYLCPLLFEKTWNKTEILESVSRGELKRGRSEAVKIAMKYGLNGNLSALCFDVYHCMLTADKPLLIVSDSIKPDIFAEFSREMMILIHYLLPESLRKEADYVSYVTEESQEAHFLFSNQKIGKIIFNIAEDYKKRSYTLLEEEFFQHMADAFFKENDEFDRMLNKLNQILVSLQDKRNQLEKCILTIMASLAGKQKTKEEYFISMERLMYWARKDRSLLKPLKDAICELEFRKMKEEELYSYTKLMLTGAGGETKELAFGELNQMMCHFYKNDKELFWNLLNYIRENHGSIYEEFICVNSSDNDFLQMVLFRPISDLQELEYAVKYHGSFFNKGEYAGYLVDCAYNLYRQTKDKERQRKIDILGKTVDEDLFVSYKKKDVELVVDQADSLTTYLNIAERMNTKDMEQPIQDFLYRRAVCFLKNERQISRKTEEQLLVFSENLSMETKMETELDSYYENMMKAFINRMEGKELLFSYFNKKTDQKKHMSAAKGNEGTKRYHTVRDRLYASRYLDLLKMHEQAFYTLDTTEWVRFVLKITENAGKTDKTYARDIIHQTKQVILKAESIELLAKVNHTLKNHGSALIHCPEILWKQTELKEEEDFLKLYEAIEDITLVKCEKNEKYCLVRELYKTANSHQGTREEKAAYAWRRASRNTKKGGEGMEENRLKKAVYYALEDILSKSLWAVLLGFYGFLFVTIREEVRILYSYHPSVIVLIFLVILYVLGTLFGHERRETPASIIYVMGMAVLLMNWGLALDTGKSVLILFIVSFLFAVITKVVHYCLFVRRGDEGYDED